MAIDAGNFRHVYAPAEREGLLQKLKFGVQEWSTLDSINLCKGCYCDCCYCYAAAGAKFHKQLASWSDWKDMKLKTFPVEKTYSPVAPGNCIMFPTTHNIAADDPVSRQACVTFIQKMVCERQTKVLVTLKPHFEVVKQICDLFNVPEMEWRYRKKVVKIQNPKEKVYFRFTICSTSEDKLAIMEPHAPPLGERLKALDYATNAGYVTTASAEPLLDADPTGLVELLGVHLSPADKIKDTGTIWLGFLNGYWKDAEVEKKYGSECARLYREAVENAEFGNVFQYYRKFYAHPRVRFKQSIKKMMVMHDVKVEEIEATKHG